MKARIYIFCAILFNVLNPKFCQAQTWMALDGGITDNTGVNSGIVLSLAYDTINHLLFAGGIFDYADTIVTPNLAMWDGQAWCKWNTSGVGDEIMALLTNSDTLIYADDVGNDVALFRIISKDSVVFLLYMEHFDDDVDCFIRYNGTYVAGGYFNQSSGTTLNAIAIWDGVEWQPMSQGFSGSGNAVYDLEIYNGDLIAGGYFEKDVATGATLHNIARWDGTQWKAMGNGLDDNDPDNYHAWVSSMEVYNGELYASGYFTYINGTQEVNHLAKWDGTNWSAVGDDIYVWADYMRSYNGKLYAVGFIDTPIIGGGAVFDGATWQSLNLDNSGIKSAMVIYDDTLYLGGYFNFVTSTGSANGIAALDINSVPTSVSFASITSQMQVYPNPAKETITLQFKSSSQFFLTICDLQGRVLLSQELKSSNESAFIGYLPAGIYFGTITSKQEHYTFKFIKSE